MIDPRRLGLIGTGQNKDSLSVLPFGQYEDGGVSLAVPDLIAQAWRGLKNFGSYGYGDDAVPYNSRMAFDAAGGAMTGGLGVGLTGGMVDNAVGSAGGNLTHPQGIRNAATVGRINPDTLAISPDPSLNSTWKNTVDAGNILFGNDETYMPAILNEAGDFPLSPYDVGGLSSAWRNKVRSTGELFSNAPTGSSVPLAMNALERAGADLPMDLASRMARAREMGFDTDNVLYHGTRQEFDAFTPSTTAMSDFTEGVYAARDPGFASAYGSGEGGRVLPLYARGKMMQPDEYRDLFKQYWMGADGAPAPASIKSGPTQQAWIEAEARKRGYSGIHAGGSDGTTVVFDPKDIRSVNAAFDPAMSDSANLLAANAKSGAAVPLAIDALEKQAPQGIRAYHGSPHDFDRFSLDKIGTGEGAQAYGHGLYFADSEDVARGYRDKLEQPYYVAGSQKLERGTPQSEAALMLDTNGGDVAAAKRELSAFYAPDDPHRLSLEAALDELAPVGVTTAGKGRMYEVNIRANPEDFLDWDKPLSQQSEKVRGVVDKMRGASSMVDRKIAGEPAGQAIWEAMRNGFVGKQLGYEDWSTAGPTKALREAGIPGIKYLDGMSRGAGEGSSNYVVFDDQLIDILRKYANAPTGAAVPLGMESADGEDPAVMEYLRLMGMSQ